MRPYTRGVPEGHGTPVIEGEQESLTHSVIHSSIQQAPAGLLLGAKPCKGVKMDPKWSTPQGNQSLEL